MCSFLLQFLTNLKQFIKGTLHIASHAPVCRLESLRILMNLNVIERNRFEPLFLDLQGPRALLDIATEMADSPDFETLELVNRMLFYSSVSTPCCESLLQHPKCLQYFVEVNRMSEFLSSHIALVSVDSLSLLHSSPSLS